MFIVTVTFHLTPGNAAAFLPAMRQQAQLSVEKEPGCHLFDVCVDPDDEHRVFLYEHYTDRSSFEVHLASAHFLAFDETVAPMVREKHVNFWQLEEHAE